MLYIVSLNVLDDPVNDVDVLDPCAPIDPDELENNFNQLPAQGVMRLGILLNLAQVRGEILRLPAHAGLQHALKLLDNGLVLVRLSPVRLLRINHFPLGI